MLLLLLLLLFVCLILSFAFIVFLIAVVALVVVVDKYAFVLSISGTSYNSRHLTEYSRPLVASTAAAVDIPLLFAVVVAYCFCLWLLVVLRLSFCGHVNVKRFSTWPAPPVTPSSSPSMCP